jgi:hypothetical protein
VCQDDRVLYADVAAAIEPTGMAARGGFIPPDGEPARAVVMIGNLGGAMWPAFQAAPHAHRDPLDTWTRSVLAPIATRLGAEFVHPSDRPYRPFQAWAQRADDVWPSPIGLLVHGEYGLWHAYRGAFLFPFAIEGLAPPADAGSPCTTCRDQPCLSACPVGAFTPGAYDVDACRGHVRGGSDPQCLDDGCRARLACPVGTGYRYGAEQMQFHMRAFVGLDR